MHGGITLESSLGSGTRATFWVPFNKAPYQSGDSPVLDMGPMPDRLQSDLALSDYTGHSAPVSPGKHMQRRTSSNSWLSTANAAQTEKISNLSDEERSKIHVLVVEDNPINQQIALKTIKKLKFSVSAVWNGQEACDYLMAPETPDHPRPDIILMDVQMPILDGYKATYTIRHAEPFVHDLRIQATPIVAMTASAIQGDREKCENAGMNDYLSKPVKGKILEQMLVKWALDARKKREKAASKSATNSKRQKTVHEDQEMDDSPPPKRRSSNSDDIMDTTTVLSPIRELAAQGTNPNALASKLVQLDFANKAAMDRSSQSPEASALRRLTNEEKAMLLRDDQLIGSGDDPKIIPRATSEMSSLHSDGGVASAANGKHRLTKENMERLVGKDALKNNKDTTETSSMHITIDEGEREREGPSRVVSESKPSPLAKRSADVEGS